MRITLVMSDYRTFDLLEAEPGESNGILYLAAYLRSKGYTVSLIDAALYHLSIDEVSARINKENPDLIGFSVYESAYPYTKAVVERLRKDGLKAHITLGGHFASFACEEVFLDLPGIDSICIGEGEEVLFQLVKAVETGQDFSGVPGVAVAGVTMLKSGTMPLIADLSSLPWQARDTLAHTGGLKAKMAALVTSRGCYAACSFCSIRSFYNLSEGLKWRGRQPEDVLDEMEYLQRDYGVNIFNIIDDNFIGPKNIGVERAYRFAEEKLRRKLTIPFVFSCRANDVDLELFKALQKAGLTMVYLGIESMSNRVLTLYNKGVSKEDNQKALDILQNLGIESKIGFILFEPESTLIELQENIRFLRYYVNLPYSNSFFFLKHLHIYRGTGLETYFIERDIVKKHGFTYTYSFKEPDVHQFIEFLRKSVGTGLNAIISEARDLSEQEFREIEMLAANWYLKVCDEWLTLAIQRRLSTSKLMEMVMTARQEGLEIEQYLKTKKGM